MDKNVVSQYVNKIVTKQSIKNIVRTDINDKQLEEIRIMTRDDLWGNGQYSKKLKTDRETLEVAKKCWELLYK